MAGNASRGIYVVGKYELFYKNVRSINWWLLGRNQGQLGNNEGITWSCCTTSIHRNSIFVTITVL